MLKNKRINLMLFAGFLIAVMAALWNLRFVFNDAFPMEKFCQEIRNEKKRTGVYPERIDVYVGIISSLDYAVEKDDFLLSFCPTYLGPCQECSQFDGPYYVE